MSTLAVVFPGQGSQQQGMLADFATQFPQVKAAFNEASAALDYNLWDIVQNHPDKLNHTEYTQPALLTASYALWQILQQHDIKPAFLAGHSLGEYTALVCAGSLRFADAINLVALRGHYMQHAVPPETGAMAAIIGLDDAKVAEICMKASSGEVLSPANFNAIGQVVIAGHADAVDRAIDLAKQQGAKIAKKIPVSVPSHCELMRPAAEKFAEKLKEVTFNKPKIPVIQNVDVTQHTEPDKIKSLLVEQLFSPVRWVETVQFLAQQNVTTVIECGPGKVLTGLIKRIDKNINGVNICDVETFEKNLEEITCN